MSGPLGSADIVSLAIALGLMIWLDALAFRTKSGTLYIGSMMLGVYSLGTIFANQGIIYSVAYSAGFQNDPINAGLWAVMFSVMILITFSMFFDHISPSRGKT